MRILVVGRRRARARDRARARPLAAGARGALRSRQRRDRRRRPLPRRRRRGRARRSSRPRARRPSTSSSSGPRRPLVEGLVDALEAAGIPAFGPSGAAARLEGSKLFAKELMAEAGVPTASHAVLRSHEEALEQISRASYPGGAEGRRAGRGQGSDHLRDARRRRARPPPSSSTERRFGETRGGPRGVPRRRGALAARPLRRRERGAAGARPGLQADRRRRRGARTPAAWAATRRSRASRPTRSSRSSTRPPAGRRGDGAARDALPRRPLRRADDDRRRAQGARVQHPLRRPRDAGGAAAAALRPDRALRRPRASRAGWPARRPSSATTGR